MTGAPCNLPDYVERGGRQVWRSPYTATGAKLLGLVLPGSQTAMDVVLQRDLVTPTGGETDYRSAHDHVVMICAKFERMASKDPPDRDRGYIPECEVSFWCLTADKTAGERLVWYLPYVFTDNGPAVAAGREVYGYPKQQADFDADYGAVFAQTAVDTDTTVTAEAIEAFDKDAEMTPCDLLTVTRAAGAGASPNYSATSLEDFASNLFPSGINISAEAAFTGGPKPSATITASASAPPALATAPPPWMKSALTKLKGSGLVGAPGQLVDDMVKNPTMVFLKQFRDVRCPGKACYQAVVEAAMSIVPNTTTSFESLDPNLFAVDFGKTAYESHPICADLGLAQGVVKPSSAFLSQVSFDILTGSEVWRAPT